MQIIRSERDNEVEHLQRILDVYENERDEKVTEMQTFKARLAVMDDMEAELRRHKSISVRSVQEHDSLWLQLEESETKQREEHRKYEQVVKEASKYKRLVCETEI